MQFNYQINNVHGIKALGKLYSGSSNTLNSQMLNQPDKPILQL